MCSEAVAVFITMVCRWVNSVHMLPDHLSDKAFRYTRVKLMPRKAFLFLFQHS